MSFHHKFDWPPTISIITQLSNPPAVKILAIFLQIHSLGKTTISSKAYKSLESIKTVKAEEISLESFFSHNNITCTCALTLYAQRLLHQAITIIYNNNKALQVNVH